MSEILKKPSRYERAESNLQTLDSVSFLDTSILSLFIVISKLNICLMRGRGNVLIKQKAQINDLKFTKTYGS